jgi:phosphatidate cytidylyltransferase
MSVGDSAPLTKSPGGADLRQRVLSAIVLIIVVLALTWAGGFAYRLLACVIASAVFAEWMAMTRRDDNRTHQLMLATLLAVILLMLLFDLSIAYLLSAVAVATIAGFIAARVTGHSAWSTAGLLYAALSAVSLAALRAEDAAGFSATIFLFAVVWVTDILAYFVGKAVGGPKLAPSISPGKTWSGAIGGAAGGAVAGAIAILFLEPVLAFGVMVLIALLLSVISQIGDLFESSLKRRFKVKDSSRLIPGHGGVMDRVDGLVAAAFAMLLLGAAMSGLEAPALELFAG